MKKLLKKVIPITLLSLMLVGAIPVTKTYATEHTGTFTAACMNVDGLPQKILFVGLNTDGPGSTGTRAISQKLATYNWDIIGVSEDFNYHSELMSSMTNYQSGTHRGKVSGLKNDTDGLNLLWNQDINVTGESYIGWNENYSSGIFGTGNGADTMIDKGYRYYQAEVAESVFVDVYILHMDADSDAQDIVAREAQLYQLTEAIISSNNGNPIIVMGDTNCRYTREELKTLFIDKINSDARFTAKDTWIEHVWDGVYPTHGSDALVAVDKGGTYEYPQAEIVDKIFYINNTDSNVTLTTNSHTVATDFVAEDGTPLADHWPIVVEFSYSIDGCKHNYVVTDTVNASCTTEGSLSYTCTFCGDNYIETVSALGHKEVVNQAKEASCTETGLTEGIYCEQCETVIKVQEILPALGHKEIVDVAVEATCTQTGFTEGTHCENCGTVFIAQEVVPVLSHTYVEGVCSVCSSVESPSVTNALGTVVSALEDGKQYVITCNNSVLQLNDSKQLAAGSFQLSQGEKVTENLIWTVKKTTNGYTISTVVDGIEMYIYKTSSSSLYGNRLSLRNTAYEWNVKQNTSTNTVQFYSKSTFGSKTYLRYYNSSQGWIAAYRSTGLTVYEVIN